MNFFGKKYRIIVLLLLTTVVSSRVTAQDCRTIAAPPPLATFGGPSTVQPGDSELAFGAGFSGTLFDCTHKLGSGWFGRWRTGIRDRLDLGADLMVVQHNDKGTATGKIALRYQLRPRLRLEAGVGGADDSDGKSLNADLGLTTGTIRDSIWNRFASLRVSAARGYPGNVCCFGGASGTNVPPGNYLLVGSIGATARVAENARFVYEGGFGGVLTHFSDRSEIGRVFYINVGVLFNTRGRRTN